MDYRSIITIEPGKRGGRPCIRGMRIAVADVLGWLAAGMSQDEILSEYQELTQEDIRAYLAYAAERERGHRAVRTYAKANGFAIVSQDVDFAEMVHCSALRQK